MKYVLVVCSIFAAGAAFATELEGLPGTGNGNARVTSFFSEEIIATLPNIRRGATFLTPNSVQSISPQVSYVGVYGSIINNQGIPICGLVLANGQYMFSCAPNGSYSLPSVPLDGNGQITLFGFADGHFPFRTLLGSSGGQYNIVLTYAGSNPNPPPPPPPTTDVITFNITDGCNDGYEIDYKFYDETNHLVWPSATTYYYTGSYNVPYQSNLTCNAGALVCYGGRTGTLYWGVDEDNSKSCTNCCMTCSQGNTLSPRLTC